MNKLSILLALSTLATASQAATLYDRTTLTGSRANLGTSTILFDDVFVPNTLNPSLQALAITSVTIGIIQPAGANDSISLFYGGFAADPDPANYGHASGAPQLLGTATGIANAGTDVAARAITFGDGVTPLFTVAPNFADTPGSGAFLFGLRFNTAGSTSGWAATNSTGATGSSYNVVYGYNASTGTYLGTGGTATFGSALQFAAPTGGTVAQNNSFYITLTGQPVPEPASLAALGVGAVALLRRRKRA